MRIRHLLCPAALALGLAAPAQAQVIATRITTPADPAFALYDTTVEGPESLAVSGTATGSGAVDLVCVRGSQADRDAVLREAIDHRVLVIDHSGRGYSFRHVFARDAIHDDMLPGERVRLHTT